MAEEFWRLYAQEKTTPEAVIDPLPLQLYDYELLDMAVLTEEELVEFVQNLSQETTESPLDRADKFWKTTGGKNTANVLKTGYDTIAGSVKAAIHAKKLGGYGVKCTPKIINGRSYYILSNFKKHQKTLTKGIIWKAGNPKLGVLGLGPAHLKSTMKGNIIIVLAWSSGINVIDICLSDEKTMTDFFGATGADIAKGVIASGLATLTVAMVGPYVILGAEVLWLVSAAGYGYFLDEIDANFQLTEQAKGLLKEYFDE